MIHFELGSAPTRGLKHTMVGDKVAPTLGLKHTAIGWNLSLSEHLQISHKVLCHHFHTMINNRPCWHCAAFLNCQLSWIHLYSTPDTTLGPQCEDFLASSD